ncbi:hypothetical protein [Flavobacterium sp.]|uniref:hypothetical protein n=1 Tax=Flavobacterium sp. TaxID=239 RepID=UPI0026066D0A|nr:hypothetical protein [Flavobacterium sp.]
MKKYIFFCTLSVFGLLAQLCQAQKINVGVAYGLAYTDLNYDEPDSPINLGFPQIGTFVNFEVDMKLPKNRYFGVGFARQQHQNTINFNGDLGSGQTGLVLSDYNNLYQKDFYDIHFRKVFSNKFQFTFGAFYFRENYNTVTTEVIDNQIVYTISQTENRDDNLGLFASGDYLWPLNNFLDAGVKARIYFSIDGIESLVLSPTIRAKF